MENQLTVFVGLTCYKARQLHEENNVPQGVIEKMLVLAHRLGLQIEGLGLRVFRRGEQAVWHSRTLVIDPDPVDLKQLTSKYFNNTKSV